MKNTKISMVRGDTLSFGIELEGLDQDLDSIYFSCKASYSDTNYIFQKSLGNGIQKVATGQYTIRVAPIDTVDVNIGVYCYDLEIRVNSEVYTIMRGPLEILGDVTRG